MFNETAFDFSKMEEPEKEEPSRREKNKGIKIIKKGPQQIEFSDADDERLRELRRKQISPDGSGTFGESERIELLGLVDKQEKSKNGHWTENNERRWLELSKAQTDSVDWTKEKSLEFIDLNERRKRKNGNKNR